MTHMVASEALTPSEPPWGSLSGEGLILVLPTKGMPAAFILYGGQKSSGPATLPGQKASLSYQK